MFFNFFIIFYLSSIFFNLFNLIEYRDNFIYISIYKFYISTFSFFLKLHTNTQFKQLLDIFCLDNLNLLHYFRFTLYYLFLSLRYNCRLFIKIFINTNYIDSLNFLFKSTIWLEREIWDMFGIIFLGNTDLRRILNDYSFEGFPLRKDFPLSGFFEIYYNSEKNRIMNKKIELLQDFRKGNFKNIWI